tara:strand:+ start:320 stop:505 length:186 start_codon:yes stop_codon:yes gene_type:complete
MLVLIHRRMNSFCFAILDTGREGLSDCGLVSKEGNSFFVFLPCLRLAVATNSAILAGRDAK